MSRLTNRVVGVAMFPFLLVVMAIWSAGSFFVRVRNAFRD